MAAIADATITIIDTHGDLLREQVRLLERLVALEEERREAERGFEELTKAMQAGTLGKPNVERDPNDPRGRR